MALVAHIYLALQHRGGRHAVGKVHVVAERARARDGRDEGRVAAGHEPRDGGARGVHAGGGERATYDHVAFADDRGDMPRSEIRERCGFVDGGIGTGRCESGARRNWLFPCRAAPATRCCSNHRVVTRGV